MRFQHHVEFPWEEGRTGIKNVQIYEPTLQTNFQIQNWRFFEELNFIVTFPTLSSIKAEDHVKVLGRFDMWCKTLRAVSSSNGKWWRKIPKDKSKTSVHSVYIRYCPLILRTQVSQIEHLSTCYIAWNLNLFFFHCALTNGHYYFPTNRLAPLVKCWIFFVAHRATLLVKSRFFRFGFWDFPHVRYKR